MQTYTLRIGSLIRELPVVPVSQELSIASFVMLGDTSLVEAAADALFAHPRFPRSGIDLLVCPEAKAIPLTHALAVRLSLDYVVVRKTVKAYMREPVVETSSSITTSGTQTLVLDAPDCDRLRGKTVCVVDDVVSTGGSLFALERLLSRVGCAVACKAAVLLEEGGYDGTDLVYLERLPVFKKAP